MKLDNDRKLLGLLFLLTLVEVRVLNLIHYPHLGALVHTAQEITGSAPIDPVHRNRVLGSYLVLLLSKVAGVHYDHAYSAVTNMLVLIINLASYECLTKWTGSRQSALRWTALAVVAFVALQDKTWLYIWDYLDVIFFVAFVYGVGEKKPLWYFGLVFLGELLNREAAVFVAIWILVDGIRTGSQQRRWDRVAGGIAMLIVAAVWVKATRTYLPHTSTGGNIFTPITNLRFLLISLTTSTVSLDFLPFLIYPAFAWLIAVRWKRMTRDQQNVGIIGGLILVSNFLFGYAIETRIYLLLIPLVGFVTIYSPEETAGDMHKNDANLSA